MTSHTQTMTTPSARLCTCGTGPNVSRCSDGHLERTRRPKGKGTKCPHREDGKACRRNAWVLARPPAATPATAGSPEEELAQWWETTEEWGTLSEGVRILWREEDSAGTCRYCGSQRLAEPSRTLVWCKACKLYDNYPEVTEWRRRQRGSGTEVTRRQPAPAEQARQADEERRELKRAKRALLAQLDRGLADKWLTDDTRSDLEDFREQVANAATFERLSQIQEQLRDYVIQRQSLFARRADLDDYDSNDDQADADGAQEWRPVPVKSTPGILARPRELPRGRDPGEWAKHIGPMLAYCMFCRAPAPLRINAAMPTAQQLVAAGGTLPVSVCGDCWPGLQTAGGPGTWQVEDLARSHRPGNGQPYMTIRIQPSEDEGRARSGVPNPTIELSGYGPQRRRGIPA